MTNIDLDFQHIILSITLNHQSIFCRHYGNPHWLFTLLPPKLHSLKVPGAKFCDEKTNFPLVKNDFPSSGKDLNGGGLLESKCQGVDQTSQLLVVMKVQQKGEKPPFPLPSSLFFRASYNLFAAFSFCNVEMGLDIKEGSAHQRMLSSGATKIQTLIHSHVRVRVDEYSIFPLPFLSLGLLR